MCRNIKTLFNFDPPATDDEIQASALQFVRKLSGSTKPSAANQEVFDRAVVKVADAARELVDSLVTQARRATARSSPRKLVPVRRRVSARRRDAQGVQRSGFGELLQGPAVAQADISHLTLAGSIAGPFECDCTSVSANQARNLA